ncbi:hypothetical protein HS088_TW14G00490 [Tripterygium wilfordii]|uniref:Uncharacterized protein n=1 Tax=Tripterygium wilfordii TaxID=458696 RepID=A0A7J7CQR8_TRIWF|nr:uncharacterized protein LOC120014820 [Tripterygium wilfordii]KAF5736348.1 hypothetical protein HS088_TW14G00490 [Tripterygium wilfordii]
MATSRIARFITEVAPPQYVTVMRSRASKVLDTINEEDRDVGTYGNDSLASSPKSPSSLSPSSSVSASTPTITSIVDDAAADASHSRHFFKDVQTSFFIFAS